MVVPACPCCWRWRPSPDRSLPLATLHAGAALSGRDAAGTTSPGSSSSRTLRRVSSDRTLERVAQRAAVLFCAFGRPWTNSELVLSECPAPSIRIRYPGASRRRLNDVNDHCSLITGPNAWCRWCRRTATNSGERVAGASWSLHRLTVSGGAGRSSSMEICLSLRKREMPGQRWMVSLATSGPLPVRACVRPGAAGPTAMRISTRAGSS